MAQIDQRIGFRFDDSMLSRNLNAFLVVLHCVVIVSEFAVKPTD